MLPALFGVVHKSPTIILNAQRYSFIINIKINLDSLCLRMFANVGKRFLQDAQEFALNQGRKLPFKILSVDSDEMTVLVEKYGRARTGASSANRVILRLDK